MRIIIWVHFISFSLAYHQSTAAQQQCQKVDIGFLLDSSGSIANRYKEVKRFIKDIAYAFGFGNHGSRVSVITFSNTAELSIKLNKYTDSISFNKAVDEIKLMNSVTRIDLALRLAQREMFITKNGGRSGISKVIVLLTDGEQTKERGYEKPAKIAEELRKAGIELIVVGIGSGVNSAELREIAGGANKVFRDYTFNRLLSTIFIQSISTQVCDKSFLQKFVGVWSVKIRKRYYITITNNGRILGSPSHPFNFTIVISDEQHIFPPSEGWFKADGGETGNRFYFRLGQNGTLEIRYFGNSYRYEYKGLSNYVGTIGVGKRLDFMKKMIGVWETIYAVGKWTYRVTPKDFMVRGRNDSAFYVLMSDNEKVFPSSHGWMKGIDALKRYTYFRLKYDNTLELHFFAPWFNKTYKGLPNYFAVGVGRRKFHRLVGVWDIKYKHECRYTITGEGIILGDVNGPFQLEKSDNERVFPTLHGWFKGIGGKHGNYLYCRVNQAGKLESIYFGPTYTCKYKTLPNYSGTVGAGEKIDFLQRAVGKWNVKYVGKYVQTITPQGLLLGYLKSPFKIAMSDNENIFPSAAGWLRAVYLINNDVIYFRLLPDENNRLENIYFGSTYQYKYQNLEDYFGTKGLGERIDILQTIVGAWSVTYGSPTIYRYAVNRDMIFAGANLNWYWNIVASDNQTIFPSTDGWYKAIGANHAEGTHLYIRLSTDDKLEVQYFGKGYTGTYKTLKDYYGKPGVGLRY